MSSAKRISSGRQFFYTYEDFQWPSYHCSNNTTQNGLYLSKVINVKSNLNSSAVQSKKISELGLQTPLFTFLLICTVYKYAKLTSINWSNFCKLNIWGNIAAVENCQIALKGVCLWNYLVCWARKFNHISVVENALLIQNWLSYKLKYSSLLLFILFLFNTIVFTLGNTIDYYLINTRWKHS